MCCYGVMWFFTWPLLDDSAAVVLSHFLLWSHVICHVTTAGWLSCDHCWMIQLQLYCLLFLNLTVTCLFQRCFTFWDINTFNKSSFFPFLTRYDSVVVGCPLCNRDRGELYVYLHQGIDPEVSIWLTVFCPFADKVSYLRCEQFVFSIVTWEQVLSIRFSSCTSKAAKILSL